MSNPGMTESAPHDLGDRKGDDDIAVGPNGDCPMLTDRDRSQGISSSEDEPDALCEQQNPDSDDINNTNGRSPCKARPAQPPLRLRLAPWACVMLVILSTLATRILNPPLNRLVELNICRTYYAQYDPSVIGHDGDVDEELCKLDPIQERLAYLLGLVETIMIICDLVVSIPFGILSDKYGRKLVLYLNLGATIVNFGWTMLVGYCYNVFVIENIILAALSSLIGGGDTIAFASLFALVADVIHDDIERTTTFAYIGTATQVTLLLSSPLASLTMSVNLWLPFWIGVAALFSAFPFVYMLPQMPAPTQDISNGHLSETTPLLSEESRACNEAHSSDRANADVSAYGPASLHSESMEDSFTKCNIASEALCRFYYWILRELMFFGQLLRHGRNFKLCLAVFLVTTLAKSSLGILLQYVSKRYHIKIAQAALLFSVKAAVSVILFTVLIPMGLQLLVVKGGYSKPVANLYGAKISLSILVIGVLAISVSINLALLIIALILYTFGSGLSLFMLALLKSSSASESVHERHNGRIYSIVGFVETVGSLVGTPMITAAWIYGIRLGGLGMGLPFFLSSVLYLGICFTLWQIRV